MSSIYDKKYTVDTSNNNQANTTTVNEVPSEDKNYNKAGLVAEQEVVPSIPIHKPEVIEKNSHNPEIASFQEKADMAMKLIDDIVLKQYLTRLSTLDIDPLDKDALNDNIRLFKINKMIYEKDEFATEKFISVVSAMTFTHSSIFLVIDGQKEKTDFYLGIKSNDDERQTSSISDAFIQSLKGQFPGIELDEDMSLIAENAEYSKQDKLLHKFSESNSISSCVGIPSFKNTKGEYNNTNFVQGIEKFALAMQGKTYTAIILATNTASEDIRNLRYGYEAIYTELSAMATNQLAYSTNESLANAMSRSKGYTDTESQSTSHGISKGTSVSHGETTSHTEGTSTSQTKTKGSSKDNFWGKASKLSGPLMMTGTLLTATGVGAPLGLGMIGAGVAAGFCGVGAKQLSESTSTTTSENRSSTYSQSSTKTDSETISDNTTKGTSHAESITQTDGTTSTIGNSKNFTITYQNKHIQEVLKRIDKQLERIEMSESTGLWSAGAYFISYGTDRSTSEIGATIFRSIMQGDQSGVETSAINTWYNTGTNKFKYLSQYVSNLSHPVFSYMNEPFGATMPLLPTSMLSSKEVAMMIGLPRKSVPGLPVVEHISLGKEVVRLSDDKQRSRFELGCIYDQGKERKDNKVYLDANSLTQHSFVTGSTGCGKSNTIYYLLNQIRNHYNAPKFLIIEPAKGEYKDVFGNEHIYGTNPLKTPLLKINPFRFPKGVHVLEHIDRLIEIFNVCWPMYAAMPAVLKEAILNAYEDCGWDLYNSKNKYSDELFPTFSDLRNELLLVIRESDYSEEVKSNYAGSLITRIKSLSNGIYKEIFTGQELGDEKLFDENVIIDISRLGSQETKALIMGILIMRLNEYRANSGIEHNSELRHITVLEEAHNILKRCSQEQSMEGSNLAGKSVEMLSNSIAEMRTYGEAFIIVDQSPSAVDISAIKNTNTKIIMRLPEDTDRKIAGKSAAMKESQVDEIAKLPTGVAVVYQSDWESPVLCKIDKYTDPPMPYKFVEMDKEGGKKDVCTEEILTFLLNARIKGSVRSDIESIKKNISNTDLSTANKWAIYEAIEQFENHEVVQICTNERFPLLSRLVSEIAKLDDEVRKAVKTCTDFNSLTERLLSIVKNAFSNMDGSLLKEFAHCLMGNYASGNKTRQGIYNAWVQNIKENK